MCSATIQGQPAKEIAVTTDIQGIRTQLKLYESLNGFFPTTEQGLQALVTQPYTEPKPSRWMQLFKELPKDPWGTPYIYLHPGKKNPKSFDLYSAGKDRKPDTADDHWGN
jgi:general secretion pathway protein G